MSFEFVQIQESGMLNRIGKLRAQVWLAEGYLRPSVCSDGIWLDELDEAGKHWAVFYQGDMIAAARLNLHHSLEDMPHAKEFRPYELGIGVPYGFMSRLVVKQDYRRQGVARKLDCLRLQDASQSGAKSVIALPTPYRVGALTKLCFVDFGLSGVPADAMPDIQIQMHVMVHYMESLPQVE